MVFGEDSVAKVQCVRNAGETGGPNKWTEADGNVELAEDFDAAAPPAWFAGALELGI